MDGGEVRRAGGSLTREGIGLHRQEFDTDPLAAWRKGEASERQGLAENHHVTGYLAYSDELRRCHPDILLGSCAYGGRHNDLGTLRREVPLLRSVWAIRATPLSFCVPAPAPSPRTFCGAPCSPTSPPASTCGGGASTSP